MERRESNAPWTRERERALRGLRGHPCIYTVSGGEIPGWGDGSDEIKIKPSGIKSSEVVIWGDSLNHQEHPRVVGCSTDHVLRNFHLIIVGTGLLSGHSIANEDGPSIAGAGVERDDPLTRWYILRLAASQILQDLEIAGGD